MKMAVGSDGTCHLTEVITAYLEEKGVELVRFGALGDGPADNYVLSSRATAEAVASGECDLGLLFCTTGTGATIVANKIPGVRAALCVDAFSAKISRLANNANMIVLGTRLTGEMHAKEILDAWLNTEPSDEPRRVNFHRGTDDIDNYYRRSEL